MAGLLDDHDGDGNDSSSSSSSDSSSSSTDTYGSSSSSEAIVRKASSSDKEKKKKKKKRRETIFERTISASDKATFDNKSVTIMQAQPAYDHIFLATLDLRSFLRFSNQVLAYQTANKLLLPTTSMISPTIREMLLARHR
eukprot:7675643-Alexandrium_andersonii.AAC.1